MKKYAPTIQAEDGEWFPLETPFYKVCCDCGLVHRYEFRKVKGFIQWAAWRNNRRTGQFRRHGQYKCTPQKDN